MRNQQTGVTGFLSTYEQRKLQRLYSGTGPSAFGSIKALCKASGLSKEKVSYFLHGKPAYTKFRQATRKFKRLKTYAKYIDEIWCMDLAYVDKLASYNNGVNYLLVCIDHFSRKVRVQPMKTKDAAATKRAFMKMLTKGHQPKKLWVDKGKEFEGAFRNYCKTLDISIYSTFSETKAAMAERAIRSLKNILYRYMENANTYKYLPKMQQFVSTMNSRINRSIGMKPNDVRNTDVFSIMYKTRKMTTKPAKFSVGDYVRISKQDIPFRKGYKPQFTQEVFKVIDISTRYPNTYTLEDETNEKILGKFYEQELVKVIS